MNAKTISLAALTIFFATQATVANAAQAFGTDTLAAILDASATPLGAVVPDADGNLAVVHVGNLIETTTREGTTTSIQLLDGDIQDAVLYDFDWAVFPEDISNSMGALTAQTDSTELLGIIIRNGEAALELQPLGVPTTDETGAMDINPVSIMETSAGLTLTTKTVDDYSMCCLISNHYPITAAYTDSEGYVDFSSAGTISTMDSGDVQATTATSDYTQTSNRR
jgi:hypothetical protein